MKIIMTSTFLVTTLISLCMSVNAAETRILPNTVEFSVNKDVEVISAKLQIRCLRSATFLEKLNNGMKDYEGCDNFKINNRDPNLKTGETIKLKKIGKNKFSIEELIVKFSESRKGHVCFAVSVDLNRNINYESPRDVYSLLSYCSLDKLPFSISDYVYNNKRVKNLDKFNDSLGRLIDVRLE